MIMEILITGIIGFIILTLWLLRKPPPLWKEGRNFGRHSRRLGLFEDLLTKMGKKAEGNICPIIFIRSKSPLTEDIVHSALCAVSRRHPLLRMRLGKENGRFTYMEEMTDFNVDLKVCYTKDWQGLMMEEEPKIYDAEKGPLWKVRFMPETSYDDGEDNKIYPYQAACVFGFHHAISDAQAFFNVFGDFVDKLHEILDNDEQPVEALPLLPPLDAYIDNADIYSPLYNLKVNLIYTVGILSNFPSILTYVLKAITKPALYAINLGVEIDRNPNVVEQTCFIPVQLTREQTTQLLAACKRHKTTVQCAIQAAACLTYSAITNGGQITGTQNIQCRVSVNLRRFFASPELTESLGMYMSVFVMNTIVGPASRFWELAHDIGVDIQRNIKSYVPFLFFSLSSIFTNLSEDSNPMNAASADIPGKRDMDLDFHNYGNFNYLNRDDNRHCKLTGCFVGIHAIDGGSPFGNMLATINGKLSWTFNYCSHICSKEQAQEFADMTIKTLLEAIKE